MYYQQSFDHGYASAYVHLRQFINIRPPQVRNYCSFDSQVLSALDALEKGLAIKDERIVTPIIDTLSKYRFRYTPDPYVLGKFDNKIAMALHYCDVLIQYQSPLGYFKKGAIYDDDKSGIQDQAKAVSIWEDAAQVGLANYDIYSRLQCAY